MEKASDQFCSLFPKSFRLLKAAHFSNLRSNFKKKYTDSFIFIYKDNNLGHARLGIAVTKKSANAVYRNKFKRMVRENFRNHEIRNKSLDILVIFNKSKKVRIEINNNLARNIHEMFSEVIS